MNAKLNQGTVFLNDLHVLDLPAMSWSALAAVGSVPRGRCQSVMVAAPDEEIVLLFGGACHNDPKPGQAYGDMVMDLYDVGPRSRGFHKRACLRTISSEAVQTHCADGRLNSDEGDDEPTFLSDMTELTGLNAGAARNRLSFARARLAIWLQHPGSI